MTDQIHRAVHSAEHDPPNGRIHGFCLLCGVPYPCEYIGTPQQEAEIKRLREALDTCKQFIEAADLSDWEPGDQSMALHSVMEAKATLKVTGDD